MNTNGIFKNGLDLGLQAAIGSPVSVSPITSLIGEGINSIGNAIQKNSAPLEQTEERVLSAREEFAKWNAQPFAAVSETEGRKGPKKPEDLTIWVGAFKAAFDGKVQDIVEELDMEVIDLSTALKKVDPGSFEAADIEGEIKKKTAERMKWEGELKKDYLTDSLSKFHRVYMELVRGFADGRATYHNEKIFKSRN